MRKVLRVFGWLAVIVAIAVGATIWWVVYRPLPKVDGQIVVSGISKNVIVERDGWGIPHIVASSTEDMVEAQGYVMAQDRLWQMDLLRRAARGQLSEIFGPPAIPVDKEFRTFGFARAAERDAAGGDAESRALIEAYARGVNQFIQHNQKHLPLEFSLLHYKPQPWVSADSNVISAYMYQTLTDTWEDEINRANVTTRVGADRAKDLFAADAAMDHFVVGDPRNKKDGSQTDANDEDDDEMQSDDVLTATSRVHETEQASGVNSVLWDSVRDYLTRAPREIRHGLGSNNWVVSGAHTATGKPLLANDTHLEMSVPSIWYEVHLTSRGWNVKGFTLPGAPMVIIGHNEHIAWGFTNNGADVQDLYGETFNPESPDEYRVHGAWSKAQVLDEVIRVKGQAEEHFKVVVTRHGPVVKREGDKAYALRWTATEPGGLLNSYSWLGKAKNWEEFRAVLREVWGPAQNAVYADVAGNIGYVMAARVPIRKKGRGEVPVPGDSDDYEWTGYIPFEQLPQALNPESGLIVTANARVTGPNYKPYLTDHWEEPYRTARIYDLLHDKHDLRPEDMLQVQTDTYSYPHVFLANQLVAAEKTAPPKDVRAQKLIEGLKDWNGNADANSSELSFLHGVRHAALNLLLEPFLGNEEELYQWRSTAFLQRILTERPAKWLPAAFKSYDQLLATAADSAVQSLAKQSKSERAEDWAWKNFDSLDMLHPLGHQGLLKKLFSITGKPQSGTLYSVRAASKYNGPAMRFVANPGNWDDSILLITTGESGQLGSSHYADQFPFWYEGKIIIGSFSDEAESRERKHTLTLKPGS